MILFSALYSAGAVPRGAAEIARAIIAPVRAVGRTAAGAGTAEEAIGVLSRPIVTAAQLQAARLPRIIIPSIGVNAPIVLPEQLDLDVMNNGLAQGVVHYPGSVLPGEYGNTFFFGHSTGLAVVNNQAYAVFNRLQELKPGNVVRLRYGTREYWYRVTSMKIKKADEAIVDLSPSKTKRLLTLSTCRIFGAKDNRFVLEAEFMKSYPLRSLTLAAGTSS